MQRLLASRWVTLLLLAALIGVIGMVLPSSYYYRVGALVMISALAAIGLNLLLGYAGQVSLGHAGFIGLGAYAVAVLPTHVGLPPLAALVLGAAFSGLLALAIGRPILRLRGHFLAVATLGFGVLIAMVLTNEVRWTGGPRRHERAAARNSSARGCARRSNGTGSRAACFCSASPSRRTCSTARAAARCAPCTTAKWPRAWRASMSRA